MLFRSPKDPSSFSHTLPEQSMLTESDKKKMGLSGRTLSEDQGFYIYRRGRLIHWGGWLGLRKMTQASKLCRVQVDVPASLDHYWLLDIKKSRAVPPKEVTKELKNFLEHLTEGSVKRQTGARNKKGNLRKSGKICCFYILCFF